MQKGWFSQMSGEKWQVHNNISFLTIPSWEKQGARVVFSSRRGGYSQEPFASLNAALHVGDDPQAVLANRCQMMRLMGSDLSNLVCCQQVHGCEVAVVDGGCAGLGAICYEDALPNTDGMVTDTPGLVLATFYADCIPVYFFNPVHQQEEVNGEKGSSQVR
jgi:copper oxidase (laccase) domain-containing protein